MKMKNLFCAVLLMLVFVTVSKADSITLNVTSWGYGSSLGSGSTTWSINAVDAAGKVITIRYLNNFAGGLTSGNYTANITGLPYTAATTAIAANSSLDPLNGTVNFAVQGNVPRTGTGTVSEPLGLNGTLSFSGQTLSFTLISGQGTISYNGAGNFTGLTITGTGGTVTLDSPTAPIPEPTTLLLLGSGLAAVGLKARRRKQ